MIDRRPWMMASLLLATSLVAVAARESAHPVQAAASPPVRILDTRDGTGGIRGAVSAGQVAVVAVPGSGTVAVNVTATDAVGPGYVTVWACDEPRPATSNLNFVPGRSIPNMAVTRVSAAGTICLEASAETHLLVDVTGWFTAGTVHPTRPEPCPRHAVDR